DLFARRLDQLVENKVQPGERRHDADGEEEAALAQPPPENEEGGGEDAEQPVDLGSAFKEPIEHGVPGSGAGDAGGRRRGGPAAPAGGRPRRAGRAEEDARRPQQAGGAGDGGAPDGRVTGEQRRQLRPARRRRFAIIRQGGQDDQYDQQKG